MKRRGHEVLLSLGSNVEPARWVPRALELLRARFEVVATSPSYASPAAGSSVDHPPFVNLAVRLRTDLPPRALRQACRHVEDACARRRSTDRFAPRTMDIDLVYSARPPADADGVVLPHPDLLAVAYVLVPCADVWPDAVPSGTRRSLAELRDALPADELAGLERLSEPA